MNQAAATSQPRLRRAPTTSSGVGSRPTHTEIPRFHRDASAGAPWRPGDARETLWRPRGYPTAFRPAAGLVMGTVTGSWRRPWIRVATDPRSGSGTTSSRRQFNAEATRLRRACVGVCCRACNPVCSHVAAMSTTVPVTHPVAPSATHGSGSGSGGVARVWGRVRNAPVSPRGRDTSRPEAV